MIVRGILAMVIAIALSTQAAYSADSTTVSNDGSKDIQFMMYNNLKFNYSPSVNKLDSDAIALMGKAKWNEAIARFDLSIKEMPNNPRALANRAFCYKALGKLKLAVSDYSKALSIAPEIEEQVILEKGRCLVDLGDLIAAENDFNKATKYPSIRAQAFSELAYIASSRQNYDDCVSLASKAIQSNKAFADAWITRGACQTGLARYAEAAQDLSQGIALVPSSAYAYLNRIGVYRAMGNCGKAKADADTVMRLAPNLGDQVQQMIAGCP